MHRSYKLRLYSGKKYPIRFIIAENETIDLVKVLVDIPEKSVLSLKVIEKDPDVAERILVVGSPMGLEQTVSEGIVSAVRELPKTGKIYQISAPISPGSSGSPVINMKGEVIGVATLYLLEGQNLNFAVSGKYILNIKQKKDSKTVSEWTQGIRTKKVGASDELYKKGRSFYLRGEYKKALPFFKKALEKEPNNADTLFYLRVSYVNLGLHRDAIEAYKQAIRIDPDYAVAHSNMGVSYGNLGLPRDRDAIEAFKQAIRIDPDYAEAHFNLGLVSLIIGNKGAALDEYKILKSLDKGLANKLFDLIYK